MGKSIRIAIGLCVILGLSSACSRETSTIPHAAPPESEPNEVLASGTKTETIANSAAADWSEKIALAGANTLSLIATPLADELFQAHYLRNPRRETDPSLTIKVWALNQSLLRAYRHDPQSFAEAPVVQRYQNTILAGCRRDRLRACRNLDLFTLDAGTPTVLRILALRHATSSSQSLQLLLLAQELGSSVPDRDTARAIVGEIFKILDANWIRQEINGTLALRPRANDLAERDKIRLFAATAATLLRSHSNLELGETETSAIFDWAIRGNISELVEPSVATTFQQVALQQLRSPALWERFQRSLRLLEELASEPETLSNVQLAPSLTAAETRVRRAAPEWSKLFQIPGDIPLVRYQSIEDLVALYAIHRIFHFGDFEQVTALLKTFKIPPERFLDISETYIRGMFAQLSADTNRSMGEIFSRVTTGLNPKNLLTRSMTQVSSEISPVWKDFYRRISRVRSYFDRELETRGRQSTPQNTQAILKFRNFMERLNANTKYTVIYPNILMFAYYAKKMEYRESFDFPQIRGGIVIDSKLIIRELMSGKFPPIFNFVENESEATALNPLEILYAIFYAVRGDLPAHYQIEVGDWFQVLADAELERPGEKLRDNATRLNNWLVEEHAENQMLNSYCAAASGKGARFHHTIPVEELRGSTLLGRAVNTSFTRAPITTILRRLQVTDMSSTEYPPLAEYLEQVRSEINPALRRLNYIKNIYQNSPNAEPRVVEQMNAKLMPTIELRRYVVENTGRHAEDLVRCLIDFSRAELMRQSRLFAEERRFWDAVYSALGLLSRYGHLEGSIGTIQTANASDELWQNPDLQNLDPNKDLWTELRERLEALQGLAFLDEKAAGYAIDFRQTAGLQKDQNGRPFYVMRRIDLLGRIGQNLERLGREPGPDFPKVAWPNTLREFYRKVYGYGTSPDSYAISFPSQLSYGELDGRMTFHVRLAAWFSHYNMQWFNDRNSMTGNYRRALQALVANYKTKHGMVIDPKVLADCDQQCQQEKSQEYRSDAAKLMEFPARMLEEFNLNAYTDDNSILDVLKQDLFYSGMDINSGPIYLFNSWSQAQHEYLPLFDDTFNFVVAIHLGRLAEMRKYRQTADHMITSDQAMNNLSQGGSVDFEDLVQRTNLFNDAKEMHRSLREQEEILIFPPPVDIVKQANAVFTSWIKIDQRLAKAFLDESEPTLKRLNPKPMQFDRRIPPYAHDEAISSYLRNRYLEDMQRFNAETFDVFLPEELRENPLWTYRD